METNDIISIAETPEGIHLLFIIDEAGDSASALGHVYRVPLDNEDLDQMTDPPLQLLATNDTLRTMWASPAGHLWVASADGFVGTTAPVTWPAASGVDYKTLEGAPWTATALPRTPRDGLPPNVTHLWGTADDHVLAAVYGGHIYRWDGVSWALSYDSGPSPYGQGVHAFGGTGPDDVYVACVAGKLLHWNGQAWRQVPVPAEVGDDGLSGVAVLPDGSVLISVSGEEGCVLRGNAQDGFTVVAETPLQLIDMALVDGRVFFAVPEGAAEFVDGQVVMRRDTFSTAAIFGGRRRAYFIEPTQEVPGFIQHNLYSEEEPWIGFDF